MAGFPLRGTVAFQSRDAPALKGGKRVCASFLSSQQNKTKEER